MIFVAALHHPGNGAVRQTDRVMHQAKLSAPHRTLHLYCGGGILFLFESLTICA